MATTLHERLLRTEARLAMVEDRLDVMRARTRLLVRSLIGWGEWLLFYLGIRVLLIVFESTSRRWSKK